MSSAPISRPSWVHATANPIARFKDHHANAALSECPRTGQTCYARTEHNHFRIVLMRLEVGFLLVTYIAKLPCHQR